MRTITKQINVYKFEELEGEAKDRAMSIIGNLDYEWWDGIEYDLNTIGMELIEFENYRHCTLSFKDYPLDTVQLIFKNHGRGCATYKAAEAYLFDNNVTEFRLALQEDYRVMLDHEYEYLTSEEAIAETCEANEYEFDENGELI